MKRVLHLLREVLRASFHVHGFLLTSLANVNEKQETGGGIRNRQKRKQISLDPDIENICPLPHLSREPLLLELMLHSNTGPILHTLAPAHNYLRRWHERGDPLQEHCLLCAMQFL